MTKEDFLAKMESLLDEYEESNDNVPIGCYLEIDSKPGHITHE